MTVVILGQKFPPHCAACEFCDYVSDSKEPYVRICGKTGSLVTQAYKRRAADCPLAEIKTPHGRLIDADSLIEFCEAIEGDGETKKYANRLALMIRTEAEAYPVLGAEE